MASIYLRNKVYWIHYRLDGRNIQRSLKTKDKTYAKFKKNEIENQISIGENPLKDKKNLSVNQAYKEFIDQCVATVRPRTVEYYSELLSPFIKTLPIDKRITDLKDKDVIDYLNSKPGIKEGMTWHIIKSVKTFMNFCIRREYAKRDQISLRKPKIPKRTPECWTAEEIKRVLSSASDPLAYGMIFINLYLGLRPAELLKLQWTDIDWKGGYLTIKEAKDSEFRRILIHDAAMSYFIKNRKEVGIIFEGASDSFMKRTARRIRSDAKIKHIKKFWYSIRHTFATEYYKRTGDLRGLKDILGHSKIEMTTVYVNPQEEHQRQQINKLSYNI